MTQPRWRDWLLIEVCPVLVAAIVMRIIVWWGDWRQKERC